MKNSIGFFFITLIGLSILFVSPVIADEGDLDLHLHQIESVQVAPTIGGPRNLVMSLFNKVSEPFKTLFINHGIKIDQNNYNNVMDINIEVKQITDLDKIAYVVDISFHYREPCRSIRLNTQTTCALWEKYTRLKSFTDLGEVENYIMNSISSAAKLFDLQFARH